MPIQHFLTLDDLDKASLQNLLDRAIDLKQLSLKNSQFEPLNNKSLATIFTKASTRTRVSFEVGMRQLGGGTVNLTPSESQIGRGEPVEDSARVISSMVDAVMIRTDSHSMVEKFSEHSSVPVINGLTDDFHPCQLLADLQTWQELRGNIQGAKVAWIGDGNNVCHSWMNAARIFDFTLDIATPEGFEPYPSVCEKNKDSIRLGDNPQSSAEKADLVVTDTWASMGQEDEKASRLESFAGYCVDDKLMALANSDALFMHCLPAYRGMEVSESVFEGRQSVVFPEAENRLHAQKALLEFLMAD